jgi:hypothetical protein
VLRRLFRRLRRKPDPVDEERKADWVSTRRRANELIGLEWSDELETWAHGRYTEQQKS